MTTETMTDVCAECGVSLSETATAGYCTECFQEISDAFGKELAGQHAEVEATAVRYGLDGNVAAGVQLLHLESCLKYVLDCMREDRRHHEALVTLLARQAAAAGTHEPFLEAEEVLLQRDLDLFVIRFYDALGIKQPDVHHKAVAQ